MHERKPNHIMNKLHITLIAISALLLSSCRPKIDGSSEEAMTISVAEIKQSLDEEKKAEFEQALGVVLMGGMDFGKAMQAAFRGEEYDADAVMDSLRNSLNGLSADDIIARAEAIEAERRTKEKAAAKEELDELIAKRSAAEAAAAQLSLFKVSDTRFFKRQKGTYIITEQPIIEMTVTNGTDVAVSHAYFTGTLQSPGRSVPWLKEDFNYGISGGLEPGESVTWSLAPNMYSEWGEVDAPADAVLSIETVRLDGPDGESAFDATQFRERDAERMEEILTEYPDLKP